jgi:tetratricopeptide (TPR) repeat protein
MDAQTFISNLLPLRGEAAQHFIATHAPEVDDLDTAAQLLKDEAQAQETRDVELSLVIADLLLTFADWTANPRHRALGLLARGNVFMRQGHQTEAIDCFNAAGEDFLKAGDDIGWARTRISYLWSASKIGLAAEALEQAERAREIFLRSGEHKRAGDLEVNLALALGGVGRHQEALEAYDRALEAYNASETKEKTNYKGWVLTNKIAVLEMLGDLHGAIQCVQEARAIFAESGQWLPVATADYNQATLRTGIGQYSAALHYYHQAREYYQKHSLSNLIALTNANMADCLLHLNRTSEALRLAEEAVAIYRTLDEKTNLGWVLMYLARAQMAYYQPSEALHTLSEAREQFEKAGAVAITGLVLLAQAELLLSQHQVTQALSTTQKAVTIFSTYHMGAWIAEAHLLQGRTYEADGNVAQAAAVAKEALEEARQKRLPWLEFGCQHLLGQLARRDGDINRAEDHFQAALTLLEGLMTWLVRDQRSTFLADKEGVFSALISLSLHRNDTNKALEYLERMKSQVLREYLTRSADIRLKASDPEEARLLEKLQQLRQELHWYSSQVTLLESAIQGSSLTEPAARLRGASNQLTDDAVQQTLLSQQKTELRRREQAITELLERAFLQHESPRFESLAIMRKEEGVHPAHGGVSVAHLAELLPQASTLLEYFIQGDDLLIFTLHAGQRRSEVTTVPGAISRLGRLMPLFRANIDLVAQHISTSGAGIPIPLTLMANAENLTRKLYDLVLHPVEHHIPTNGRLIIVPFGPLHSLPFHALRHNDKYLIEQCEVAYLPAAAMLALQKSSPLHSQTSGSKQKHTLVLGHSHNGKLPYTLREARSVARLLGTDPYLEEQATIERLSNASKHYSIIHIAAHGQNRADAPDFAYLQLADGQLNTIDVFNLDLPNDLITLSGCETGLAVIGGGDELLGLARGFLYAGARALLMSLWRVEDASTAHMMEQFYQRLLAGESRAAALRGAQQALLAGARAGTSPQAWQHPYFWSPFRLVGAADPIPLSSE